MTATRTLVAASLAIAMTAMGTGSVHAAPTVEQRCESARNQLAAKYALCRAKAEGKLSTTGDAETYTALIAKCDAAFAAGWDKIVSKAISAGGACADIIPEEALQDFVAAFSSVIADVAAGGDLPPDASICLDDLATCDGELGTCQSGLAASAGDLATCQGELATSASDLAACEADLLCGDGVIDAGEDCDVVLGGATCSSATGGTLVYGTLGCSASCELDTSACHAAICGNGEIEGTEICDTTEFGSATCSSETGGSLENGILVCDSSCALVTTCCDSSDVPGFRNAYPYLVLDSTTQLQAVTGPPDDTLWTFEVSASLNHGDYIPSGGFYGEPTILDLSSFIDPRSCGPDSLTFSWVLIDSSSNEILPRGLQGTDTPVVKIAANTVANGLYILRGTATRPADGYVMEIEIRVTVVNSGVSQLPGGDTCANYTEPTSQCGFLASLKTVP